MATLKRNKSVQEALQFVADHPVQSLEDTIDIPCWELIGRRLFDIANHPDKRVRGSMARATRAQKLLLDRLVGRRRPGTHPVQSSTDGIEFLDLTVGVIAQADAKAAAEEKANEH